MSRTLPGRAGLAGAALSLALGLAACGGTDSSGTATAAAGSVTEMTEAPTTVPAIAAQPAPEAVAAPPTTSAAPATTAAPKAAPPTTAARSKVAPTTPSAPATAPAPPTTAAPVTPKFAPGQRINPTTAQVHAAMATLTQRIPLFKPNEAQLKTFADAACTSFDQGQTFTQVSSTIRQAVTYVQGASLSVPDSDFAVRTVVTLRCPGYLP